MEQYGESLDADEPTEYRLPAAATRRSRPSDRAGLATCREVGGAFAMSETPARPDPVLQEYERLWQQGQPPDLDGFLAAQGPLTPDQLLAVVRIDLVQRWRVGQAPPVEAYLRRFPALAAHPEAYRLVAVEVAGRRARHEKIDTEAFLRRFPQWANRLDGKPASSEQASAGSAGAGKGPRPRPDAPQPCESPQPSREDAAPSAGEGASTAPDLSSPANASPQQGKAQASRAANPAKQPPGPTPDAPPPRGRVVEPGYRFNNRYLVERELGHGGMGKVFLARDEVLNRPVAVKVIRPKDPRLLSLTVHREEFARAFLKEAQLGAKLKHQCIAQVFDSGIDHGEPFTVFEYVDGETLREMLGRRGRLPLEEAQDIVAALAQGLAYAHANGVIHRDLKPANICITPEGQIKILDLGVAAQFREHADWHCCGTPAYMAPEQAAARPCDGRTDQYALAVIAYELMTGRPPFMNASEGVLLQQHLRELPPDPRQFVPDLPAPVATAILRGLAKKPEERFASCEEFATALGCQLVRRAAESARFIRLARLTATKGHLLSVSRYRSFALSHLDRESGPLYIALASDGLYLWHREDVTRWTLTELTEVRQKGATLTVRGKDGTQRFTFASTEFCSALHNDLHQLLANPARAKSPEEAQSRVRRSVFLLPRRVWFAHQLLGTVAHEAKTKQAARVGLKIQAHLLGADAVTEVQMEQLPTFFNTGYRCSGVAIRAVEQRGRVELAAHWLEQRAAALAVWMLAAVLALSLCLVLGASVHLGDPRLQGETALWSLGLLFGWPLVAILSAVMLRGLRWPQLVKPVTLIVVAFLVCEPLAMLLGTVTLVRSKGMSGWFSASVLISPEPWLGFIPALFLLNRSRQFSTAYRYLLAGYRSLQPWRRRIGLGVAWIAATAFSFGMVGYEGLIAWGALTGPSKAMIDKANRANEAFQNARQVMESDPVAAEGQFRQALPLYEELCKDQPRGPWSHQLARTYVNLANIALRRGQKTEAEHLFTEGLNRMEVLVRERPNDTDSQLYPQAIAEIRAKLAELTGLSQAVIDKFNRANEVFQIARQVMESDPIAADQKFRQALSLYEQLCKDQPANSAWSHQAARTYVNLANIALRRGQITEAEHLFTEALNRMEALVRDRPNDTDSQPYPEAVAEIRAKLKDLTVPSRAVIDKANRANEAFQNARQVMEGDPIMAEVKFRQALPLYEQLCKDQPNGPWSHQIARTYLNLAVVTLRQGQTTEAEHCFTEALNRMEALVRDRPNDADSQIYPQAIDEIRVKLKDLRRDAMLADISLKVEADAELKKGAELQANGQYQESLTPLEHARTLYAQLVKKDAKEPSFQQKLGQCYHHLGLAQQELNHADNADTAYRQAVDIRNRLLDEASGNREYRRELAESQWVLGKLCEAQNRWRDAVQWYRNALAHYGDLAREPSDTSARYSEAACHNNLAWALENEKSLEEASNRFQQAAGLWEKLGADFPDRTDYRISQARSQNNLARVLRSLKRWPDAEIALCQLVKIRRKLAEDMPGNLTHRQDLARAYWDLAQLLEALQRWEDAAKEYQQAVSVREQLVLERAKDADLRWDLAATRNGLGLVLQRAEHKSEAEQAFRAAASVWGGLADDFQNKPEYKFEHARTLNNLSQLLRETKRLRDAAKVLRQVEALRRQAAQEAPKVVEYAVALGDTQAALGLLELDLEAPTSKTLEWFDRALQTLEPHLKDQPFGTWARRAAVDACRGRAVIFTEDDKFADAITAYDRLLELCPPEEQPWYRGWRARCRVLAGDLPQAVMEAGAVADDRMADADDLFLAVRVLALAAGKETDADQAKDYTERALLRLRQAVTKGFKDLASLKELHDLNALRSRKEFGALIKELESQPKK
jgi:serine/threonine protein kinase/tetratricopeptide (TPR) repeat protein